MVRQGYGSSGHSVERREPSCHVYVQHTPKPSLPGIWFIMWTGQMAFWLLKKWKKNRKGQGTGRPVRMLRQQKTTGPDRVPFETATFFFQKVTCHVMLIEIQHVCPSWCAHLNLNTKIQILLWPLMLYLYVLNKSSGKNLFQLDLSVIISSILMITLFYKALI